MCSFTSIVYSCKRASLNNIQRGRTTTRGETSCGAPRMDLCFKKLPLILLTRILIIATSATPPQTAISILGAACLSSTFLLWSWIKSVLWFPPPPYSYIILCCCAILFFCFINFSQGVMDNLRASILPWAAPAPRLVFAAPPLSLVSSSPFPTLSTCAARLRPSNAFLFCFVFFPFPFLPSKKNAAHLIRPVFKQRLQNDVT